ncbi:unnamed protein product, partial [Didymodactylos carnosus]
HFILQNVRRMISRTIQRREVLKTRNRSMSTENRLLGILFPKFTLEPAPQGLTPYMNKKTKSFTHIQYPADELAYRSTPEYLRKLLRAAALSATSSSVNDDMNESNIMRTKSANDLSPKSNCTYLFCIRYFIYSRKFSIRYPLSVIASMNKTFIGNPKYKSHEDYYDEVATLKKQVSSLKDENSSMRTKIRRLDEENARRIKEIDGLCDTSQDGVSRKTLSGTDRNRTTNVLNLKQKLFKLEQQLKEKEATISKLQNDPMYTKTVEIAIRNKALSNEIERQKIEKLNIVNNSYPTTLQEETKNAVQKLTIENRDLLRENKMLHKKLDELDENQIGREREIKRLNEIIEKIKRDRDHYREQMNETESELSALKREYDRYKHNFKSKIALHDSTDLSGGRSSPSRMIPTNQQNISNWRRDDLSHRSSPTSMKRSNSPLGKRSDSDDDFTKKDTR